VEITCHGGILITEQVLGAVLAAGARAADAGEFTRRAYIFGKMKLTEAEALGNLLEAGTQSQLSLARSGKAY
jgi:tRNA modification GTPase